jgi:hypothetical protein
VLTVERSQLALEEFEVGLFPAHCQRMKTLLFIVMASLSSKLCAMSDPCGLVQAAKPAGLKMTDLEIQTYESKLKSECQLATSFHQLRTELKNQFAVSIENITQYQAMRFVRRQDYDKSKLNQIPVELTYQILNTQYSLPNSQKSPVIWDNWIMGMKQLAGSREQILAGKDFTFNDLKRVHIGFFKLSKENGDSAWIPNEGIVKPANDHDNYWWDFSSPAELASAKALVDNINQQYREMGLLPHFSNPELNRVLLIKKSLKRQPPGKENVVEYVDAIYSGDTRANVKLVENILGFVNRMLQQAVRNKPMVWNGKLMTPGEVAYLVQKFYVGVHPFSEGNGRTSRYLQELILTSFDMPHGSSGDLMDADILNTFDDYYNLAIQSDKNLVVSVSRCVGAYKAHVMGLNTPRMDQNLLDYDCRILKN